LDREPTGSGEAKVEEREDVTIKFGNPKKREEKKRERKLKHGKFRTGGGTQVRGTATRKRKKGLRPN